MGAGHVDHSIIHDNIRIAGVIDEPGPVPGMSRIHAITRMIFIPLRLTNINIKRVKLPRLNVFKELAFYNLAGEKPKNSSFWNKSRGSNAPSTVQRFEDLDVKNSWLLASPIEAICRTLAVLVALNDLRTTLILIKIVKPEQSLSRIRKFLTIN